jgi:hypothetical protein
MNWRTSTTRRGGNVVAVLAVTGALLTTSGAAVGANERSPSFVEPGLVGAWTVQVTLRDCETNVPLGLPFNSLVTFHDGGTISESAGGVTFAPGQRSAGHGVWTRRGRHIFKQKMVVLINFDTPANLPGSPTFNPTLPISPGFFAGWQTVTHTLELIDADHAVSSGTNAFYKSDGSVYRTGCSTAVDQRFR